MHEFFDDELRGIPLRVASDDQVIAATQEWRECFAATGFDLNVESPDQIPAALFDELARVDPADADELEQFRTREISIAVENLMCQGPLRMARNEVLALEYERSIADNEAGLLALLEEG